jgi:endonuclease/exonuclease/phosphatase (EEP) superfamily protein YafD
MKIVFLNVWNFKVRDKVKEFIKGQSNDTQVFCLQEALREKRWLLRYILPKYTLVSDCKYVDDIGRFSLATYVKKDIKILAHKSLLNNFSKTGSALHLQVKHKNKLINICNVHGISRPGDKTDSAKRLTQSQKIIEVYKNLGGLKIIGGDFNLEINTKSTTLFEKDGYVNLIKKYKILTTRNRLAWDEYPNNKQYFSDYVFVEPKLQLTEFLVPNIEISNHLPMILNFKDS